MWAMSREEVRGEEVMGKVGGEEGMERNGK